MQLLDNIIDNMNIKNKSNNINNKPFYICLEFLLRRNSKINELKKCATIIKNDTHKSFLLHFLGTQYYYNTQHKKMKECL